MELKEKMLYVFGALVVLLLIINQQWMTILNPAFILGFIFIREAILNENGKIQAILFVTLLAIGRIVAEYHFQAVFYFEYILIAFFMGCIIYNIYKSSSAKRFRNVTALVVIVALLMASNIYVSAYMESQRVFKDANLQRIVSDAYEDRFIDADIELEEGSSDLERIDHLNITGRTVRSLEGIEHLPSLWELGILGQNRLLDYSELAKLENLKRLTITDPHPDFNLSDLPKLENLEWLTVRQHSLGNQEDEIIELSNFPNLTRLSIDDDLFNESEPLTIDITEAPHLEDLSVYNTTKIVGLEEAENLERISIRGIYNQAEVEQYKDEIRKLRPDIEVR
ncbi:hypothetical protein PRVXH_001581 [Proteinivorax hydrogeniformans]|uniref:Leucine-rich repeat domain-containing protein n=1 Tax=Proteinivorax hydrogeniformans TaxID=1826727 RepID=A0AAU8HR34_9FIRM